MKKLLKSFGFAWKGIVSAWSEGLNFRIQIVITLVVFVLAALLGISPVEWAVIVIAAGLVLFAEVVNTAIEDLCDHVEPGQHQAIAKIKDMGAASVLILAATSLGVALFIFYPYLF